MVETPGINKLLQMQIRLPMSALVCSVPSADSVPFALIWVTSFMAT